MARLVIFDETVRGVDLSNRPVILGRSRSVDIPIHDRLLSRKHCSIVPTKSGFQVIDLKSSNGTFLNGTKIEKQELKFEDIVEIGNTVMTILDTDTWKRGRGLPRLRHPSKAKALIQAIKKREVVGEGGVAGKDSRRKGISLRQRKVLTPAEREFLDWAREEWTRQPVARELLQAYATHQVVSLIVRHSPEIAERLSAIVEKVLVKGAHEGTADGLREAVRKAVEEVLAAATEEKPQREDEDEVEVDGETREEQRDGGSS